MVQHNTFCVSEQEKGIRIDVLLAKRFSDYSRTFMQKLIQEGKVKINGKVIKRSNYKVLDEAVIELEIPNQKELEVKAENICIDIIYEDDYIIIVNKPRGMVVHPAPGHHTGTLVNALLSHVDTLSNIGGSFRAGIVHRLDKDTSGVLIVAKKDETHKNLIEQFKKRKVIRKYIALVHGNIKNNSGIIDAPIGRHHIRRQEMAVTDKNSKRAITRFKVLERFGDFTLIEALLKTGRTHQIRVHMAYIGNPLVGDLKYGFKKTKLKGKIGFTGQALHAGLIGFCHPGTGEYMEFTAPLPQELVTLIENLRKKGGYL